MLCVRMLKNYITVCTVQCKKVDEVFTIGSTSFARGTSSQSYNEFVGSRGHVNFVIPRKPLVLCSRFGYNYISICIYVQLNTNVE